MTQAWCGGSPPLPLPSPSLGGRFCALTSSSATWRPTPRIAVANQVLNAAVTLFWKVKHSGANGTKYTQMLLGLAAVMTASTTNTRPLRICRRRAAVPRSA